MRTRLMSSSSPSCRRSSGKAYPSLHRGVVKCRFASKLWNDFPTALCKFIMRFSKRESEASQRLTGRTFARAALRDDAEEQQCLVVSLHAVLFDFTHDQLP